MKKFLSIVVVTLLFVACNNTPSKYETDAPIIEQRTVELLSTKDKVGNFYFSTDRQLQKKNTNIYWLMNAFMLMGEQVGTPADAVAWYKAMEKCVNEYNLRSLRRSIDLSESLNTIETFIAPYRKGNQAKQNTIAYVDSKIALYKTIGVYLQLFDDIKNVEKDEELLDLFYQEFGEWFKMYIAKHDFINSFTYAAARHGLAPSEKNMAIEDWAKERFTEVEIESYLVFDTYQDEMESDEFADSYELLVSTIADMKAITETKVHDMIEPQWVEVITVDGNYMKEVAASKVSKSLNYDKINRSAVDFEVAFNCWLELRKQIEKELPKSRRSSYAALTKKMIERYYNDWKFMSEIVY